MLGKKFQSFFPVFCEKNIKFLFQKRREDISV